MSKTLQRETFVTSREMDFCSEKELRTQTGHERDEWPLVFLKESIDNALDACEEAGISPFIDVVADDCSLTVRDNGSGIPGSTIEAARDFTVRASAREAYVAPDRGAQGNALKTLLAMPFVVDPNAGKLIIEARGTRHELVCRAHPISQRPIVLDDPSVAKTEEGTTIRMEWASRSDEYDDVFWPFDDIEQPNVSGQRAWHSTLMDRAVNLLRGYALFNPHLRLRVTWFGTVLLDVLPTNAAWRKWNPSQPTNALWYELPHLERLIAAYLHRDRQNGSSRTVSEFIAEFDGLSSTKKRKAICDATGLTRQSLEKLTSGEGLNSPLIGELLTQMQLLSKEVKPVRLGIIGKDHFVTRFCELGADIEQIEYAKVTRVDAGLPYVVETAFAWLGEKAPDVRNIFTGVNWSAAIKNPFRSFGTSGVGLETQLTELNVGPEEPVAFALHFAHPRIEYTNHGKSEVIVDSDGTEANDMTEDWE